MKKIIIVLVVIVLAGVGYLYISHKNTANVLGATSTADTILFYGIGCPHCQKVEDYMSQNKVTDKIQIDQREVFANKSNAELMATKAADCGISKDNLGVPLLWVKGKCYSGDEEVIQYFKDQLNGNQ